MVESHELPHELRAKPKHHPAMHWDRRKMFPDDAVSAKPRAEVRQPLAIRDGGSPQEASHHTSPNKHNVCG
jgi:hypothetical protein